MKVQGVSQRTIWVEEAGGPVFILDQTRLPHALVVRALRTFEEACEAISEMRVRGAPLIGITGAYALGLALRENASNEALDGARGRLVETRPTAINLAWAVKCAWECARQREPHQRADAVFELAGQLADRDAAQNEAIGVAGAPLLQSIFRRTGRPVQVLTHCNAGWLATVDFGTALAPVYAAQSRGVPLHVWVDETRPRNQGAALTAWELGQEGVPHTVVVDNAGGHLMQRGMVDICLLGSDRTTANGDVGNKVGTYLKALAAKDNGVPFYVALPSSTIDWSLDDGLATIPIELRSPREVTHVRGMDDDGVERTVRITPLGSPARNDAFDVTPARLVTGLITERGVCAASARGLDELFPERGGSPHAATAVKGHEA